MTSPTTGPLSSPQTQQILFRGQDLTLEVEGSIASIVLNRPPVNAFRLLTWQELQQALATAARASQCAVLLLRSAVDGIFTAGADVKELPADDAAAVLRQEIARGTLQALGSHRTPVAAVIDGAVIGGGCALVSQADVRIASPRSRFALPEIDVGRAGGARHLLQHLDQGTVRWMALTGGSLPAADAHARGLVTILSDDVLGAADVLAQTLAGKGVTTLALAKEAIVRASELGVDEGYGLEQEYSRRMSAGR
jgi:enoyl-CoA hydratase